MKKGTAMIFKDNLKNENENFEDRVGMCYIGQDVRSFQTLNFEDHRFMLNKCPRENKTL